MSHPDSTHRGLHLPQPFTHQHPPIQNVNEAFDSQLTWGERASDAVANTMGSWRFIIIQIIGRSV